MNSQKKDSKSAAKNSNSLEKAYESSDAPSDLDGLNEEQTEVLLRLYQENGLRIRHYESQRSTAAHIIIAGTVGLVTLIRHLDFEDWPLTVAIALVGFFGAAFTAIYFWLIENCEKTAHKYHKKLDSQLFGNQQTIEKLQGTHLSGAKKVIDLVMKFWPLFITIVALYFTYAARKVPRKTLSNKENTSIHAVASKKEKT